MALQILQDRDDVSRWDRCPKGGIPPVMKLLVRLHEVLLGTSISLSKCIADTCAVDPEAKVRGKCREETDVGLVWC